MPVPDKLDRNLMIYDSIFDDFHYDIGHGKGTGSDRGQAMVDEISEKYYS